MTACEMVQVGVWVSLLFHNKRPIKQYLNGVLNIVVHGGTAEISSSFEPNEVSADKVQSCWTGVECRAEWPWRQPIGMVSKLTPVFFTFCLFFKTFDGRARQSAQKQNLNRMVSSLATDEIRKLEQAGRMWERGAWKEWRRIYDVWALLWDGPFSSDRWGNTPPLCLPAEAWV